MTLPPSGAPALSGPTSAFAPASYTISWTSVSGATSYQLEQRLNGGSWTTVHNGAGTSKAFSGMYVGGWGYRIRACNSAGCGSYSAIHTVWVDNIGGCNPPFCEDPDSVPGDPPVSW